MKVTKLLAVAGLATAGFAFANSPAAPTAKADPAKGKALAEQVCAACHGADGNGNIPLYPRLAGQHEDYLRKALGDYQSGARRNPVMKGMVASLSARDLDDLAAWFASQPNGLTVVKSD